MATRATPRRGPPRDSRRRRAEVRRHHRAGTKARAAAARAEAEAAPDGPSRGLLPRRGRGGGATSACTAARPGETRTASGRPAGPSSSTSNRPSRERWCCSPGRASRNRWPRGRESWASARCLSAGGSHEGGQSSGRSPPAGSALGSHGVRKLSGQRDAPRGRVSDYSGYSNDSGYSIHSNDSGYSIRRDGKQLQRVFLEIVGRRGAVVRANFAKRSWLQTTVIPGDFAHP